MRKIRGLFKAHTVSESCTIDMRFMLRNKNIIRGRITSGVMEWQRGQAINFHCDMSEGNKYLSLTYNVKGQPFDYSIFIDEVPSNLGIGTILYFLCPESGKRSRILISAYGEPKFINRGHYHTKYGLRVYYGCQNSSKEDYHNSRYFDLKRKVDQLESELNQPNRNSHYRGRPTREQRQLVKYKSELNTHNRKRWESYNKQASKRVFLIHSIEAK